MLNKRKIGLISFLTVMVIMLTGFVSVFAKDVSKDININHKEAAKILSVIDNYQAEYFEIIKRNDVLLSSENDKALNKDRKALNKLNKKVKKQITNKEYLSKYDDIQKRYAKCDEITNTGMNDFAEKNYNEVDALLNEVYQEVKSKISANDFKKLTKSENKWLKEVNKYEKVFNSKGYGTIGTLIYYDYQIDMREFRTLLLMLYL